METLEPRQLLALGPQLAGIQPNDGSLLTEGQVRNIAPDELVFHFSDEAALDQSTIASGIRITRSGFDGTFSRAIAASDFNTNGAAVIDFTAVRPGVSGNGITISVIKNPLGFGQAPRVTVLQEEITVELNSTAGSTTRAGQLVAAINTHAEAGQLVTASVRSGTSVNADIASPFINYSPIVTGGANAASATTNLNAGSAIRLRFTARTAGPDGNGTQVILRSRNFGGVHAPEVLVNAATAEDRVITVEVNSNAISPTTVDQLIQAIENHPVANSLVEVDLVSGSLNAAIGDRVGSISLRLEGANDTPITPGFIGLGETSRQVVMRFSQPLPDDLYHVEIIGTGPGALRNIDGAAFGDITEDDPTRDAGADFELNFELDLGAQILAIVPQPVSRNAQTNQLSQARNEIHVYYNNDDLHSAAVSTGQLSPNPSVVDPDFYQLIFTNNTVQNTDDVVYRPSSISYDPATDRAVLVFNQTIDALGSGAGTFRLRIGTDESMPVPPAQSVAGPPVASTDFGSNGDVTVTFTGRGDTPTRTTVSFSKRDFGGPGAPIVSVAGQHVSVELNTNDGNETTAQQLVSAVNGVASQLLTASLSGNAAEEIATTAAQTTLTLAGVGSSFDTATNLSVLDDEAQVISSAIEAQQFDLQFPGSVDEPGHRKLRDELGHNFGVGVVPDPISGITTAFYNFEEEYGFDPQGNVLRNAITESQKQRTREAFTLYSEFLGIQFVETNNLGMTIVTGDPRALGGGNAGAGGTASISGPVGSLSGTVIMDVQDLSDPGDDAYGAEWFQSVMGGIGHLMGIGFTDENPSLNVTHSTTTPIGPDPEHPENTIEPIFPGAQDVNNGQHLFRPDSKDIDLYRFELTEAGRFSAETFAERLPSTSLLDTTIALYRQQGGQRTLIARNDDYYSNDSFLELDLRAGIYWVGVSASGNDDYDANVDDSGLGGRSEGAYDLRLNFRPNADRSIVDFTGVEFDGDADGVPGGVADYWFRAQTPANTLFVDKASSGLQIGSLQAPFRTISAALSAADPGDVVRIVGNGGTDGLLSTEEDNLAYQIGFNTIGNVLPDGATLEVPKDVHVMIDSGAVVKLRRARVGVGSSTAVVDRSAGSLQVLGTPVHIGQSGAVVVDEDGLPVPGSVFFTSLHDDLIFEPIPNQVPQPAPGDWGGLVFRSDIDAGNVSRFSYDRQGIFLNYVSNADIRFGGGIVLIDGVPQVITPVHITDARPTVQNNTITLSADAAVSASPNSFAETNFHSPAFQFTPFTSDYDRVGPNLYGNTATDNSINGLFVRVTTQAGNNVTPMTVSGRWDDTGLPHIVSDRLIVRGTAGGHILEADTPPSQVITLTAQPGGQLSSGAYRYRIVFVDDDGNEGPASDATGFLVINDTSGTRSIRLNNLPAASQPFVSRRIYRSDNTGNPNGIFVLVAEINANSTSFLDLGNNLGATLSGTSLTGLKARQDARLAIDPGVIVKLNGGAIETTFGADLYAEGVDGFGVVFTSAFDDRFGGGGTFDTTNDAGQRPAVPGDWGGIFVGPGTRASIDHALLAFGGGEVNIEGTFTGFNALEIHQSPARVAHSLLEDNASGTGGQAGFDRAGRGFNRDAVIFVRGSQPVLVDNSIIDNQAPAISVDVHSLDHSQVTDYGRSTYGIADAARPIDSLDVGRDNQGPLVALNRLRGNEVNGMQVRGGTVNAAGVWDDAGITHVLRDERVYVADFHTFGGLRLESSAAASLVVKLDGPEAGIVATGQPLDNTGRIGGSLRITGRPGHPVILTSIHDCTVGAGFSPDGSPVTETLGSGSCVAAPGDWDSIRLDEYSSDRNVEVVLEEEASNAAAPGLNGATDGGEFLGSLAPKQHSDDDNRRLGFEVHGNLSTAKDVDVYSFNGVAGTEVWFDVDFTSTSLDTVIELIDASGAVLARSDNSFDEAADPDLLFESVLVVPGSVLPLHKAGYDPSQPGLESDLQIIDHFSTNPKDAGMRVLLPGQPGSTTTYHVRVRSAGQDIQNVAGGLTKGNYEMQIRVRELDEVPGSTIRFADIRYATNGIEVLGQPAHSPLLGEVSETEFIDPQNGQVVNGNDPGTGVPQEIGNLAQTDQGAISIAGNLLNLDDVDFYRLTIDRDDVALAAPNDHFSTIFDIDYADGLARANSALWVFDSDGRLILTSKGSNIADDRPRPLEAADIQDLTRGSVGPLDPYIGPVELPAGPITSLDGADDPTNRQVYFVAVSSNAQVPEVLSQYQDRNAANPLIRLEPINSVRRIAEDRIGFSGGSLQAQPPEVPILLDINQSPVPFQLSDVSLFVSQQVGLAPQTTTTLRLVDAYSGQLEATAGSFPQPISDIAFRGDGNLFAFGTGPDNFMGPFNDGTIGGYVQIDTGTAAATTTGDDGVGTFVVNRTVTPPTAEEAPGGGGMGVGVFYDAITFSSTSNAQFQNGWAVGSRNGRSVSNAFETNTNDPDDAWDAGIADRLIPGTVPSGLENVLFHFDIFNGLVANPSPPSMDREDNARLDGLGSQKHDWGEIRTFYRIVPSAPETGDSYEITINGKTIRYTAVGDAFGIVTTQEVVDGLANEWRLAAERFPEYAAFEVLNSQGLADELRVRLTDPDFVSAQIETEANNGGAVAFESLTIDGGGPGGRIKGIDFIGGQMYGVTDRGGLFRINPGAGGGNIGTYVTTSAPDLLTGDNGSFIQFSGLTAGPDDVANGRYANMLFGITVDGTLYAFDTNGVLQPVFVDGQTSVETGLTNVHGLEFSPLDRNLWQTTNSRGGVRDEDRGHGLFGGTGAENYDAFDHSRVDVPGGGTSFFFGNDRATNEGGNQSYSNTPFIRDYNFPDGAHGSLISQPFSLVGYSPADIPVLYFNYFLETEDTPYDPTVSPLQLTRDTFRVFVGDDSGEWNLLATNNEWQDFALEDEFDIGEAETFCTHPAALGDPCVQEIFDNTGQWRQARIVLSRFAGRDSLRLKFEFATAGEMDIEDTFTSELRAVGSSELRDGQVMSLDFNRVLEFDLGFTLDALTGSEIDDGDSFTVTGDVHSPQTFLFDSDNTFSTDILTSDGSAFRDGETFTVISGNRTAIFEFDSGISLLVPPGGAGQGGVSDGETFVVNDLTFEFDSDGQFGPGNTLVQTVVDQGLSIPRVSGGISDGQRFLINDGQGGANVLFEFDSNGVVDAVARPISLNNIELQIPVAGGGPGGVSDGDTIAITSSNANVVFEFDKDNSVTPGNFVVSITNFNTQDEIVEILIDAFEAARIGLNPANLNGGVLRLGVFDHVVSASPPITPRVVPATFGEIADRLADSILNAGLGVTPINAGNGVIRLGSTTLAVDATAAPSVSTFDISATQDELADLIAFTVASANAGAGIVPLNLGGGEVFLGQPSLLDTSGAASLSSSGEVGLDDPTANPVIFDPTQTANQVAFSVASAISGSTLAINATNSGDVVLLPASASFSPNGSALRPEGVIPVPFNASASPEEIAASIEDALAQGFASPVISGDFGGEENDDLSVAVESGFTGGPAEFVATGFIGDNLAFELERARDVDLVKIELNAGDELVIEATGQRITVGETIEPDFFPLNPAVRLFDSEGEELASASSGSGRFVFANGVFVFVPFSPRINFTAVSSGTYYVGVSDSQNLEYYPHISGSADVVLQVPSQGGGTNGLTDGEIFSIDEGLGAGPKFFEFDSDLNVRQGATPISIAETVIEIPAVGVGLGGISDGDFFSVNDNQGAGEFIFEYDNDFVTRPGAISIRFFDGSPFTVDPATDIFTAPAHGLINGDIVNLATTNMLPGGLLVATNYFVINATADTLQLSLSINGPVVPVADVGTGAHQFIADPPLEIAQNTIIALVSAGIGLNPQLLSNSKFELGTTTHSADFSGTNESLIISQVPRTGQEIIQQMRSIIRRADLNLDPQAQFGSLRLDVRTHEVDATLAPNLISAIPTGTGSYDLSIEVENPLEILRSGNRLNLAAVNGITMSGLPASFVDGSPGVTDPNRTAIPIRTDLEKNEVARAAADAIGRAVSDYHEQIVAVNGGQIADGEVFSVSDGVDTVNFEFESGYSLQIPNISDPLAILDGENFSVTTSGGQVTFEFDDDGVFSLGTQIRMNDLFVRIPALGMLDLGLNDGDTFTVDRGPSTPITTFEFDTDGVTTPDTEIILVTPNATAVEVANAMVEALEDAGLGFLAPEAISAGVNPVTTMVMGMPVTTITTLVDVRFGVTDHEVDLAGTQGLTSGLRTLSLDDFTERVISAMEDAGLSLNPTNLGNGLVHIGGASGDVIDIANAVTLDVEGRPGANDSTAIVMPVFPAVTTRPFEVGNLIESAITTAIVSRGLDIELDRFDSRRIHLSGSFVETNFSRAPSVPNNRAGDFIATYENIITVVGHNISNSGPFGSDSALPGDDFGAFTASGPMPTNPYPGALRGMDNAFEGVYIDDIIIGFAERGEMVLGATANTTFVPNVELLDPVLPFIHNEILTGAYQLEIRNAEPFGITLSDAEPEIFLTQTFDTNDRLTTAVSVQAPAGADISDGRQFTLSDGTTTVTLEFEDLVSANGTAGGSIAVPYRPGFTAPQVGRAIRDVINSFEVQSAVEVQAAMADGVATGDRFSPVAPISTSSVINLFGNAILNFEDVAAVPSVPLVEPGDTIFQAQASGIGTSDAQSFLGVGTIGDNPFIDDPGLDVDMIQVDLNPGESITIDVDTVQVIVNQVVTSFDAVVSVFDEDGNLVALNDDFDFFDPFLEFTATTRGPHYIGVSGFSNLFYSPLVAGSGSFLTPTRSTGNYEIRITRGIGGGTEFAAREFEMVGDSNVLREQGQILIHSNQISNSLEFGIMATSGSRDGAGNAPHLGPARVTQEVNANRLTPGITIANNVISLNGMGGIHFSGETSSTTQPSGAVPVGRIVNNTIVGGPDPAASNGIGIDVGQNASPTLLNNIVAYLDTGVSVDPTSASTVLAGTLYQNNSANTAGSGVGSFPIVLSAGDPLFVDVASDNLYLASGSRAIDSSVDTVQDRPELISLRTPLGLGVSPILAPDRDALGQTRVDDPTVETPAGQGTNIFKDRGALDRADFAGPTALLLNPLDNDAGGDDSDSRVSFLELTSQVVTDFSIQLLDGVEPDDPQDGTGADGTTVNGENISVLRDGVKLEEGRDYKFTYDETNKIIRLTPLAGIWEPNRVYEIELANSVGFVIQAPTGTEVSDGDQFTVTDLDGDSVTFEYESGYVLHVPQTFALQIPAAGGAAIADGETFTISDGINTAIFEFDNNNAFVDVNNDMVADNELIVFDERFDSANAIASKIVQAIFAAPGVDLAPVNILNAGGRAVHLGSRDFHTLDTSNTTLTQTGQAGGVDVEQTLVIDDGTRLVEFDFVANNGVGTGANQIGFGYSFTHEQIADAIVTAISAAGLGLAPVHVANSDGLVHVGGTTAHIIDVSDTALTLTGAPGVRPEWGIRIPTIAGQADFEDVITPETIVDGETFSISNGQVTETFEVDDSGLFTPGNHPIAINSGMSADQVANIIAIAIRDANLGLTPANAGNGIVSLGGDASFSLNVSNSSFQQVGQPGVDAAQPVFFSPGAVYTVGVSMREAIFDETDMAAAIAVAINGANTPELLDNVEATVRDEEVLIDGVASVSGPSAQFLSSVRDVAGNPLKPNRTDDTTRFTIFIGTGIDFGDAPVSYGTLESDNGPRHESVEGFFLGSGVDIDIDGQPTINADGDDGDGFDDEDGVVFNDPLIGGQTASITVTASRNGLLDAWIDFNGNGTFDFGERIADSLAIAEGETTFSVGVPGDAAGGLSYARFRISSGGGLGPLGAADDGEVEDHAVTVQSNPWRNSALPMDVSGDMVVSPIDVLLLINNININGSRPLPAPSAGNTPPPFLDVNGDGSLTAVGDVLPVINFLNTNSGSAEGEFGGEEIVSSSEAGTAAADSAAANIGAAFFTGIVDHRLPVGDSQQVAAASNEFAEAELPIWQSLEPVEHGDVKSQDEFEDLLDDLAADTAAEDDLHGDLFRSM